MYAAIGAPVEFAATVRNRMSAAREAFDALRDRLPDDAVRAFDDWAAEGERLVDSWSGELKERGRAVGDAVRQRAGTVRETGRGLASISDAVAPVDRVDGIGPAYAEKLVRAGVPTVGALIERCRNSDAVATLAEQTDISPAMLEKWARSADLTRLDGVGSETMVMLNGLDVVTLDDLAEADTNELRRRALDRYEDSELVSAIPSRETLDAWADEARRLG